MVYACAQISKDKDEFPVDQQRVRPLSLLHLLLLGPPPPCPAR